MGVPTIVSLTPAAGLASGDQLITIVGTNFRPAVPDFTQPDPYPIGTWPQTAAVLFDGVASPEVKVQSTTRIQARLPPGDPGPGAAGRSVTVTVINLDPVTGPIPGESIAVPNAFLYQRPVHTTDYETDLTRLFRGLLQLMKRQLLVDEVNYAVQTDYDPATGDELHITKFAKLPGIALVGPELRENRFYSLNEQPTLDDGTLSGDGTAPGGFLETRVPYTVDAIWTVIAASDTKTELLNLMANFVAFMHKNKWLAMNRSATDPTKGQVRFELDFMPGGQPKSTTLPNNSNVRAWAAEIVIRGFDIETPGGIADGWADSSNLVPRHAVVDHGQTADEVILVPVEGLAID